MQTALARERACMRAVPAEIFLHAKSVGTPTKHKHFALSVFKVKL
jgi:hypothetical protein